MGDFYFFVFNYMHQLLLKLTEQDILLYQDMCESNNMVPHLVRLTAEQIYILLSLRQNGLVPEYSSDGERYWRIPKK